MRAGSVAEARPANQQVRGGARPTPALHSLQVRPIPILAARRLLERQHYLHSLPGGTHLAFGVFVERRLLGAVTLGVGPFNAHSLVKGAGPDDCLTLTRLWLSDLLPKYSESRILAIVVRALKHHSHIKFVLSYADPARGHLGTIYQAAGWIYIGLSQAAPLYDLGDGNALHSRSFSHAYGSHSLVYFSTHGIDLKRVPQDPKHRYVIFLDATWRNQLRVPVLPYPKSEVRGELC